MIQSKPSEKGEIITYLSRMGDVLHNVSERKKIIIPIQTVMTIIDSDQPNLLLAQHFLNLTDHQIITSQPAHILYDHRPDLPGFDGIHHADKSRAVKR